MITLRILERFHLGTAFTAMVTACFHGHSQIGRAAEGRNKQRHQKRNHALRLLDQVAALKIGTSCHLCFHDLVRFFHQNRNKTQSNGHHHGNLMNRHTDLIQKAQTLFESICQLIGCGRQRHNRRTDYQIDQAQCHKTGRTDALMRNFKNAKLNHRRSRCQKQVEAHTDQQQKYDCL